jgi:hypothetical protein
MKRSLILACLCLLTANILSAQTGVLCLFSDPDGTDCTINDIVPGLITVHVFHTQAIEVTGVKFSAPMPDCMNAVFLGETFYFPLVIGGTRTGVTVSYESCLSGPIRVSTMNYFGQGLALDDCPLQVRPHPDEGRIVVVDCGGNERDGAGGTAFVNSDLPCVCTTDTNPLLYVKPLELDFGLDEDVRTFLVANTGGGTLQWNVSEQIAWLEVSPVGGAGSDFVTVTVDRTGLSTGHYTGSIDIASNGGNETVTVTMAVPVPAPVLGVSPASLVFGPFAEDKTLAVFNAGTGDLHWSITSDQPWLSVSPTSGINDTEVTVHVDRAGMPDGTHYGFLTVVSNGGDATVPVAMTVSPPSLWVSPTALNFGSTETDKLIYVSNAGSGELHWNVTSDQLWLSANPISGTNDADVTVHVERTGLADGAYQGALSVTSNGGEATVAVEMWVGPRPILGLNPRHMMFSPSDTTKTLTITNFGDGTLQWTLSADKAWIEIVPPLSGTGDATVTVNVHPASVPAGGVQVGHITVNSNGGNASVEVRFIPPGPADNRIDVYSEPGGGCNFLDDGGLIRVYLVHALTGGALASRFRLDVTDAQWTYLADNWNFPLTIGTSVDGASIAYGQCLVAPIALGSVSLFGSGAPECTEIRIVPDPEALSGNIEVVDCADNRVFADGGYGVVNPNLNCLCGDVAVRETTWGGIKAMYVPKSEQKRGRD